MTKPGSDDGPAPFPAGQVRLSSTFEAEPNVAGTDRTGYVVQGDSLYYRSYNFNVGIDVTKRIGGGWSNFTAFEVSHFEHRLAGSGLISKRKEILDGPSYHLSYQLTVSHRLEPPGGNALSISQHGEAVGNLADLFKEVAYVDDANTLIAQPSDQSKEPLHVFALKAAGRFVHENDAGSSRDGPANLDHLLGRERKVTHAAIRPNFGMLKTVEDFKCLYPASLAIEPSKA